MNKIQISSTPTDPRYSQIIVLSILLGLQFFWADFGPEIEVIILTLGFTLLTQIVFCKGYKVPFDYRSPLITGLSLTILLKASTLWIYPLAGVIAVAGKFLLRKDNKHIFNPANLGIVAMLLLFPSDVWISPGQWGSSIWIGFLLACSAMLVLFKIPRRDIAFLFLGLWGGLLLMRAIWLGDPLSIPMHQLQSGAVLIFAFFMISDPKTIPDRFVGRVIFALAISTVAFILTFEFRIRESLFYALALICLMRPFIDHIWQGSIYEWNNKKEKP